MNNLPKYVSFSFLTPILGNLNRDENGRPKTLELGGTQRVRLSSQAQKAVWRRSPLLVEKTGMGVRTRADFLEKMSNPSATDEQNRILRDALAEFLFGVKKKKPKDGQTKNKPSEASGTEDSQKEAAGGQLVSLWREELELCEDLFRRGVFDKDPKKMYKIVEREFEAFREKTQGKNLIYDLFGAMSTANAQSSIATMMVANAISVHPARIEVDYFTSIDDLDPNGGAGFLSDSFFSSGLLCSYVGVDVGELILRIANADPTKVEKAHMVRAGQVLGALLEVIMTEFPKGKRTSYAQTPIPIYMRVEFSDLPLNPQMAFLDAIPYTGNIGLVAIGKLQTYIENLNRNLGREVATREWFPDTGSIEDLKRFLSLDPIPTLDPKV